VLESCLADLSWRRRLLATRESGVNGKTVLKSLVAEFMSRDVRSIHRAATIKEAGLLLLKYKVDSLIVDDGSRYIGIVTDSDLSRKAVVKGLDLNTTTVMVCKCSSRPPNLDAPKGVLTCASLMCCVIDSPVTSGRP
jgi:CBS-domain-containing membrane protein